MINRNTQPASFNGIVFAIFCYGLAMLQFFLYYGTMLLAAQAGKIIPAAQFYLPQLGLAALLSLMCWGSIKFTRKSI